ncbi:M20/M25/M40 family metallo-hydrolase [Pseudoalteromonas luteoviolacea]|uniref:M20/M25/M40 family metallo-hydrolase n=1 Tax=Pseudoalteromonas luteoviolacea TaxID=43657 RepID=UPI00115170E8|nr:M20/M25/M40 family metallo-hydrolase [Pseudoalteromonas luteoviolacea]TQF71619.1 M20/M25/M40 family metallo-hydrolase [Pseudoalteromonas luteoviolacea]
MQWLRINTLLLLLVSFYSQASTLSRDMTILTSIEFEGRPSGASEPHRSAFYIHRQFEKFAMDVEISSFQFKQGFFGSGTGHNVVATMRCTLKHCQPALVITAHYDHLGKNGYKHYPGANDNATGVAVMIDIARQLNGTKLNRDIIFVATDAEEKGLHGAKHFVSQLDHKPIFMNINLDMLDMQKRNELYALASSSIKPEKRSVISHFERYAVPLKMYFSSKRMARRLNEPQIDWLRASDHYPFHRAKIPFIYFGSGVDKNHHTTEDALTEINLEKLTQVSNSITGLVRSYADSRASETN